MAEHALDTEAATGLLDRWRQTEPVRLWLYGVAIPLLAALVGYGLLSDHTSALWLALVQAALLGGGTELARGFAVSPATARAAAYGAAMEAAAAYGAKRDTATAAHAMRLVSISYRIPS